MNYYYLDIVMKYLIRIGITLQAANKPSIRFPLISHSSQSFLNSTRSSAPYRR